MVKSFNKEIIYGLKSKTTDKNFFVNETDFQSPLYDFDDTTIPMNELKKIQKKLIDGKQVTEYFVYKDASLWWFFYPQLWYEFKLIMNFITNFQKFIEEKNPKLIKVKDDFNMFSIIRQICNEKNIPLAYSHINLLRYKLRKRLSRNIRKNRLKKITKLKIDERKKLFFEKYNSISSIDDKIILATPVTFRKQIFNPDTGKVEKGEYIIQELIDLLNEKEKLVGISLDNDVHGNLEILSERLDSDIPWFPLEVLLENNNQKTEHKEFYKKYRSITKKNDFRELFQYKGIKFWEQIQEIFEKMAMPPFIPYWIKNMESLEKLFSNKKPRAIFLPYETGPLALSFIVIARKFGIMTIGIQHGIIYEYHDYYSHEKILTENDPLGFPFPSKMLLFGEYSKKILIQNGYPSENLITFGNPVFFNLNKIESVLKNSNKLNKFGLNNDKIVILFTTNILQETYESTIKHNYDTRVWEHLLKNFGNDDRFSLILKPHPLEDSQIYKKIISQYHALNAKVIQGSLLDLLYCSNIVVSTYSTTIIDALCLKKPVIHVEFAKIKFLIPLGNAVITSKLEDLSKNVLKLVENDKTRIQLVENAKNLIKEQYNIPIEKPDAILNQVLTKP